MIDELVWLSGAAYACQCSRQHPVTHSQQATEPGGVHRLGVLDAIPPSTQSMQGSCKQNKQQRHSVCLQCLEGPSCAAD